MKLADIRTLLIDGDGVLWKLDDPIPGIDQLFESLGERGINWALLTNNATRSPEDYAAKLRRFGVSTRTTQVFGSANVTGWALKRRFPEGAACYVIGGSGLKTALSDAGMTVHDGHTRPDSEVAAVVVGMDTELTYHKLAVATLLIRDGAAFFGSNPDKTFPSPYGILPGAGSLLAALVAATDVEPEIIGKPAPAIFQAAMESFDSEPEYTAMLGDRMETDILGAQRLGLGTILVLTGVTRRDDLPDFEYQPDLVFDSIAELAEAIRQMEQ